MTFAPDVATRFFSKVDIRGPDECWQWKGKPSAQGYGRFGVDWVVWQAHRVSLILAKGPIPEGMFACHTCDNRLCVNPAHLWAGTHKDNINDMIAKGRCRGPNYRGEKVGTSKLTEAQAREAVALLDAGNGPASIARRIGGVTPQAISSIKSGVNWAWLREAKDGANLPRHPAGDLQERH